jgi:AcrR family transcriptional regulator
MTPSAPPRPRRGTPEATRERLIAVAAEVFNRDGYHGTDSNALAREAGYSPATFYKHFPDKRTCFLAAYQAWVDVEWGEIERIVLGEPRPERQAAALIDWVVSHHRRWRGLRASLRALTAEDAEARSFYLEQRRRQLMTLTRLRAASGSARRTREEDAVLLFLMERTCDAFAEGELELLGLSERKARALLERKVTEYLIGSS